jgi:hypothetical protein
MSPYAVLASFARGLLRCHLGLLLGVGVPLVAVATLACAAKQDPISLMQLGLAVVVQEQALLQVVKVSAALLLLVAAAAGDPLGEGVERLLICHGWAGASRFSPSALA